LLLAGFFLEENRSRLGLGALRLSLEAQAALLSYDWPGNVRELEHTISRSALKAWSRQSGRPKILTVTAQDVDVPHSRAGQAEPAPSQEMHAVAVKPGQGLRQAVDDYERQLVLGALARNSDNWASTARELGLDRANLNRMARRLGIK
jgi:anaerobic nitric oxide reductase transcription regulator